MTDGEDYELLFTLPSSDADHLLANPPFDTPIARIGKIVPGDAMTLLLANGKAELLSPIGYRHQT